MAQRVLLIGWDAADWGVIDPLVSAGRMPNLASLIARGVRGTLAAPRPLLTPMLWTTIATGRPPFEHGVIGHTQPWRNRRGVSPINALSRAAPAIWELIDRAHAIAWPVTHPVAEHANGVIVSDRFAMFAAYGLPASEADQAQAVYPRELRAALAPMARRGQDVDAAALRQFVPRLAEIDPANDRRLPTIAGVIAETMTIHGLAHHVLENEGEWHFAAVHFPGLERLARLFMEFHPPRRPSIDERELALYQDVMVRGYELHDRVLGSILEAPRDDATVLLVSDHGFHFDHHRPQFSPGATRAAHDVMADTWHRPEGIAVMSGRGVRAGAVELRGDVLDVAPTVLALLGLPRRSEMPGRAWREALSAGDDHGPSEITQTVPTKHATELAPDARDDVERASDDAVAHLLALGYTEPADPQATRDVEECEFANAMNVARYFLEMGKWADAMNRLEPWASRRSQDASLQKLLKKVRSAQAGGNTR